MKGSPLFFTQVENKAGLARMRDPPGSHMSRCCGRTSSQGPCLPATQYCLLQRGQETGLFPWILWVTEGEAPVPSQSGTLPNDSCSPELGSQDCDASLSSQPSYNPGYHPW